MSKKLIETIMNDSKARNKESLEKNQSEEGVILFGSSWL
jgi:hypothetical protein